MKYIYSFLLVASVFSEANAQQFGTPFGQQQDQTIIVQPQQQNPMPDLSIGMFHNGPQIPPPAMLPTLMPSSPRADDITCRRVGNYIYCD